MSILEWVRGIRSSKLVAGHVDRIVARHLETVRDATVSCAAGMPPAEARGYIRAKAVTIVSTVLSKHSDKSEPLDRRLHDIVLTLSAERLTATISSQLSHGTRSTVKRKAA